MDSNWNQVEQGKPMDLGGRGHGGRGHSSAKYFNIFVKIDFAFAVLSTIFLTVLSTFVLVDSYSSVFPKEVQGELPKSTNAEINDAITVVRVYSWMMLAAAGIGFFIEVYLFTLARRGLQNNNYGDCQKWFRIRMCLLVLGCMYFAMGFVKEGAMDLYTKILALIIMATAMYRVAELLASKPFIDTLKLQQTGPPIIINPDPTL